MRKARWWILAGIGVLFIVALVLSWILFPGWRGRAHGWLILFAEAAAGVVAFARGVIGILKDLGFLGGKGQEVKVEVEVKLPPAPGAPYTPPLPPPSDTLPNPGPLPPGSHMAFRRNQLFTGREEDLKALARALLYGDTRSTLVTQAVHGMGGVGKTQLAVEFACRYGRFFHGVHWISAAEPANIAAEVAACGRDMCLPHWPEEQEDQVSRTLYEWQQGGSRLVIVDNLEDVEVAREWLARLGVGPVRLLVTSRRSDWPADLGVEELPLDLFTRQESHEFLRKHLPEGRASEADLDALADRLGDLPLALELAGRYLAEISSLTVQGYLEQLEEALRHPSMLAWRQEMGNPTGHDLDLMGTFAMSWDRVEEENARRVFLAAGYCAPNAPIPRGVLAGAAGLEEAVCDEALGLLAGLGLVQAAEAGADPVVHPLLGEFARHQDADGGALPGLVGAVVGMVAEASDEMARTGAPSCFEPLLVHVRRVADAAEERELGGADILLNYVGYYLHRMADFRGSRAAYDRALAILEAAHGSGHPRVAPVVHNLGRLLHDMGDLAGARAACERALAIDEAVYGPDHPAVVADLSNLSLVLRELGELAEARAACERALAIAETVYSPDHLEVARAVGDLGLVLHDLGEFAGARAALERALEIDEAVYGPDHPEVATRVNNLGSVLRDLGDLAGARAAFERALALDEAVFGPEHPAVGIRVNNLGLVLRDMGDLAGARAAFERALRIDEAAYGSRHPKVGIRVNNLGLVLLDLGDLAGARAAFERALRIDEAAYGPDHPAVGRDVNNLSLALWNVGDLAGARAALERALAIAEAVYGPDHPTVATVVNNLGMVLQDLGDLVGARAAHERALAIDEAAYGPDHPTVARDVNNLGMVLQALGDLAGARAALERALAIFEKVLPPGHPKTETVRRNLEIVRQEQASQAAGEPEPGS